ncbi:hypothetical protein P43SY_010212 [Pythium insidiosum]|uniref:Uncharacterized protein n=1 Tax=Pythium insidiosum TaxID=114742 RepID=A0AAD5M0J2_PYTIN|nr:hypothetical protein P43SY_010212 [Pythium insidiosum]
MKFESGKALVTYVKAYALQTKKEVRVDPKSKGSKTRVILCTEEICPFKIVAYKSLRLEELNPGTITRFDLNANGEFKGCLVVCGPSVKAQYGMQLILGVDGAHCTHRLYNGKQLLIEAYVEYVRSDFVAKLAELKSWKDAGRMITPRASDAFGQQTQDIGAYKVEKISDDIFHVFRSA